MAFAGCTDMYRDEIAQLHNELDKLKIEISTVNDNISALHSAIVALQSNDYITEVRTISVGGEVIGYDIYFAKAGVAQIRNGKTGKDGYTPTIGVKQDKDGVWYWTVDGNFIKDNDGNKIRANAQQPVLKIENDYWYVSYDDGATWNKLGPATGGDAKFFKDVKVLEQEVVIILNDASSTEIRIPRYQQISITFDKDADNVKAVAGSSVTVKYTLSAAPAGTVITVATDGSCSAKVNVLTSKTGEIVIDCPASFISGTVTFFVYDGCGHTFLKVLKLNI